MIGSSPGQIPGALTPAERSIRKERMLCELQATMRKRAFRRAVVKMATVFALPCVACGLVVELNSRFVSRPGIDAGALVSAQAPAAGVNSQSDTHITGALVAVVHTDPSAVNSLIVTTGPQSMIKTLTDDELLDILSETGHPSGIVRVGGEAFITNNATVADPYKREPSGPGGPGVMRRHGTSQAV